MIPYAKVSQSGDPIISTSAPYTVNPHAHFHRPFCRQKGYMIDSGGE